MIAITCSCGKKPLLATLIRRPDEVVDAVGRSDRGKIAEVVFSIECTGCKAQTFFSFFGDDDGSQRVELTYKAGGICTQDPNTCTKPFCDWPQCGH